MRPLRLFGPRRSLLRATRQSDRRRTYIPTTRTALEAAAFQERVRFFVYDEHGATLGPNSIAPGPRRGGRLSAWSAQPLSTGGCGRVCLGFWVLDLRFWGRKESGSGLLTV